MHATLLTQCILHASQDTVTLIYTYYTTQGTHHLQANVLPYNACAKTGSSKQAKVKKTCYA